MRDTRYEWLVSGMDCAACSLKVTKAVERLPGVSNVSVALMAEKLTLDLAPDGASRDEVEAVVRQLGYGVTARTAAATAAPAQEQEQREVQDAARHDHGPEHDHDHDHDHDHNHGPKHDHGGPAAQGKSWYQSAKGRLVIVTGILLAFAWGFELLTSAETGYWGFLLACLIGVAPVARRAWAALRLGQPFTIEALMTLAALGALVIGAAEEAALVVFLFAVGEVLEGVAAGKARDGIRALAALVPKTAWLEVEGRLRETAAEQLRPGDIVLVRPGDRIPADGIILEGSSGIDESPVTGESMPVTRSAGDPVFAGAINTEAALRITVSKAAADNTISRIVKLVEEAEEARAPTERFIDRFSRWYMPAIVALAALVVLVPPLTTGADWATWTYRGLALLLIGCPCALVISVPASIASALSAGARRGLLMKGGAVIEAAAAVTTIALDKTGTLTHGRPQVTDVLPAAGVSEAELLTLAASVESSSSHPLAQAILRQSAKAGLTLPVASAAKALPGKGAEAMVDGALALVISPRYAAERGGISAAELARATALEREGKTVVAVFHADRPYGLIALRDELRDDAATAMRQLRDLGIAPVMLTGDNARTAAALAQSLGIDHRAEMLPEDKLTAIAELAGRGAEVAPRAGKAARSGGVMMIGDGINDAPALKKADVGVAMGSGTDVALETADAAILRNRVVDAAALIRLARACMANIRQNVAIALGLKAVFLVTSILGLTGLWLAIMADTGATVLVTLNALRLLRLDPERHI